MINRKCPQSQHLLEKVNLSYFNASLQLWPQVRKKKRPPPSARHTFAILWCPGKRRRKAKTNHKQPSNSHEPHDGAMEGSILNVKPHFLWGNLRSFVFGTASSSPTRKTTQFTAARKMTRLSFWLVCRLPFGGTFSELILSTGSLIRKVSSTAWGNFWFLQENFTHSTTSPSLLIMVNQCNLRPRSDQSNPEQPLTCWTNNRPSNITDGNSSPDDDDFDEGWLIFFHLKQKAKNRKKRHLMKTWRDRRSFDFLDWHIV